MFNPLCTGQSSPLARQVYLLSSFIILSISIHWYEIMYQALPAFLVLQVPKSWVGNLATRLVVVSSIDVLMHLLMLGSTSLCRDRWGALKGGVAMKGCPHILV